MNYINIQGFWPVLFLSNSTNVFNTFMLFLLRLVDFSVITGRQKYFTTKHDQFIWTPLCPYNTEMLLLSNSSFCDSISMVYCVPCILSQRLNGNFVVLSCHAGSSLKHFSATYKGALKTENISILTSPPTSISKQIKIDNWLVSYTLFHFQLLRLPLNGAPWLCPFFISN